MLKALTFKDLNYQVLMTIDNAEKLILTLFRKIPTRLKKQCMDSIGRIAETGRVVSRLSDRVGKGSKGKRKMMPK